MGRVAFRTVIAETKTALQDKLADDVDTAQKAQSAAAQASAEELARLAEVAQNEEKALQKARGAAKAAGDGAYQRALDEKAKLMVQLADFDQQILKLKDQDARAAQSAQSSREANWDRFKLAVFGRLPANIDSGQPFIDAASFTDSDWLDIWLEMMPEVMTWTRMSGALKAVGGVFETAAGLSFAIGTSWSVVGIVVGGSVALHGVDTFQSGVRQAWTGEVVDSLTSEAMQGVGLSRRSANLVDTGISVFGCLAVGILSASSKAASLARTEGAGLSTWQVLRQADKGSKALPNAVYSALGGETTSALTKAAMMEQGVVQGTNGIHILKAFVLAPKGLTALGDIVAGVGGALCTGLSGVYNAYYGEEDQ